MVKFRFLLAALIGATLACVCALAQSNLTQIRDTIINPDGSPFSGRVVITWNGFSIPNGTPISELSASAQIYTGALSVLLVPTTIATAGTYYQVVYSSNNGTVSWTETWQVPPSATPLTVSQVRQSTTEGSGTTTPPSTSSGQYATLPISIPQVTNLSADLSSINVSIANLNTQIAGIGSGSNITALQNTVSGLSSTVSGLSTTVNGLTSTVNGLSTTVTSNSNSITTLTGNIGSVTSTVTGLSTSVTSLTNTVSGLTATVNALSSSGTSSGGSTTVFVDEETPAGALNGTNTAFTLANSPSPSTSLELYRNGLLQSAGVDYLLSGSALTFQSVSVPQSSDILQASYRIPGTGTASTFVDAATPSGATNGTNLIFTLSLAPSPAASLKLYKNGLLLSAGGDYSLSGMTITFASVATTPQTGDVLLASYRH